ncbi:MAG: uroporphyrinogen-III synthase, partial [Hydrogenophaga sp.]
MVTRPEVEAVRWAVSLGHAGWPAQAFPLMSIGAPSALETLRALDEARAHWSQWDALMFVSGAAVAHFFAQGCVPALNGSRTRFWAPGPGTGKALAEALHGVGIGANRIDAPPTDAAQFDSEALWPMVSGQMGPG